MYYQLLCKAHISCHGPDRRLIASTEINSDESLLDWSLNSVQFAVYRSFAGIHVLSTRFVNS